MEKNKMVKTFTKYRFFLSLSIISFLFLEGKLIQKNI